MPSLMIYLFVLEAGLLETRQSSLHPYNHLYFIRRTQEESQV